MFKLPSSARFYATHSLPLYARPDITLVRGKGCLVYDTNDKEYLDLAAGIAVNALGHGDEDVISTLEKQARKVIHVSNLFHNEHTEPLATELIRLIDSPEYGKVFFCNSGTEANEGAFKFARKYARSKDYPASKHKILSFTNAFHGRSMGALSATPAPKYQAPFAPLVPGFHWVDFNDVEAAKKAIDQDTCAVIVEPIQGEGGIHPCKVELLQTLRQACDKVDALLIYDEIQCGLGRTGKLYGHQSLNPIIVPDMVSMAKPLANGIPIGAVVLKDKVAEAVKMGDHGTTFGGNPLAAAVARTVLEKISNPKFLKNVQENGKYFIERLQTLNHPGKIKEVRGGGMMLGIELEPEFTPQQIVDLARDKGVLVIGAGCNTVRMVPPLILTRQQIDKAVKVLDECFKELK